MHVEDKIWWKEMHKKWYTLGNTVRTWAKSKIGHHCDGRNFFSQLSFLSSQKPRHFMYITWINNHCTLQKHQWGAAMIKHVTVETHLKVRRTEFCSKILSVGKIHFRLSCFSSCVILHREYTTRWSNQHTSIRKGKIEPQLNTLLWQHNL